MRGKIYYWADHLEYPRPSELTESSIAGMIQDRYDLGLEISRDCMWFFLQEDYYAVYYQNGQEYKMWHGSAKAAWDFLIRGEIKSSHTSTGIILPTGELVQAPHYGGDRDRWEKLGV